MLSSLREIYEDRTPRDLDLDFSKETEIPLLRSVQFIAANMRAKISRSRCCDCNFIGHVYVPRGQSAWRRNITYISHSLPLSLSLLLSLSLSLSPSLSLSLSLSLAHSLSFSFSRAFGVGSCSFAKRGSGERENLSDDSRSSNLFHCGPEESSHKTVLNVNSTTGHSGDEAGLTSSPVDVPDFVDDDFRASFSRPLLSPPPPTTYNPEFGVSAPRRPLVGVVND